MIVQNPTPPPVIKRKLDARKIAYKVFFTDLSGGVDTVELFKIIKWNFQSVLMFSAKIFQNPPTHTHTHPPQPVIVILERKLHVYTGKYLIVFKQPGHKGNIKWQSFPWGLLFLCLCTWHLNAHKGDYTGVTKLRSIQNFWLHWEGLTFDNNLIGILSSNVFHMFVLLIWRNRWIQYHLPYGATIWILWEEGADGRCLGKKFVFKFYPQTFV